MARRQRGHSAAAPATRDAQWLGDDYTYDPPSYDVMEQLGTQTRS
jgi:hypothetical protein